MSELVQAAVEWAAANGPPNWVFILALLTAPARWTSIAIEMVQSRLGADA